MQRTSMVCALGALCFNSNATTANSHMMMASFTAYLQQDCCESITKAACATSYERPSQVQHGRHDALPKCSSIWLEVRHRAVKERECTSRSRLCRRTGRTTRTAAGWTPMSCARHMA